MPSQPETEGKTVTTDAAPERQKHTERRSSRRCKITQLMRIRPSDPQMPHFEDMRGTLSVSRNGLYFQTSERGYEIGMRLFVTLPYSQDPMSLNREYLAEVVRKDPLATGMTGIGLKLLMEMGLQQSGTYNSFTGTR
jgi:PilZ domain